MSGLDLVSADARFLIQGGNQAKIAGYDTILPPHSSNNGSLTNGNFDFSPGGSTNFSFGCGVYKIEFYFSRESEQQFINYVYLDFRDADFDSHYLPSEYNDAYDIRIDIWNDTLITFQHSPGYENDLLHDSRFYDVEVVDRYIKMWNFIGTCLPPITPGKGLFTVDTDFSEWPINANRYNGNIGQESIGNIGLNIRIDNNISTHDTLITAYPTPTVMTVKSNSYLSVGAGKIFNMITPTVGSYNNLIVEDSALLSLGTNAKIEIHSPNKITMNNKSKLSFSPGSQILVHPGGLFCNEGTSVRGNFSVNYKSGFHSLQCQQLADYVISDSVKYILDSNAILPLSDSTILHFKGPQTSLILKSGAKIQFGKDSKIILDSGATLIANNASFVSLDTSETWEGIVLNNSGVDSIINCTFSNAKTSISIINDANHSNINRIVKGNTFNIPSGELGRGIYGENNYRLLVQNNTFNMPLTSTLTPDLTFVGLYLKNSSTGGAAGEPEESEVGAYTLNIVGNTFNNGCASAILANYLSNVLPYNIHRNTFNYSSSANLIGIQISGAIKNNEFTSDDVPLGIHLVNSSPDLYNNEIEAKNVALHLAANSYPNLGPTISSGDMIWNGGLNKLHTTDIDNIQLSSASNIFTDWGNNNFAIDESGAYHIYGWMDSTVKNYYSRDNCWNLGSGANISLAKDATTLIVPAIYLNYNYDCYTPPTITDVLITNKGNGIYDSVYVTADVSGVSDSEMDMLYYQADEYVNRDNYPAAIVTLKNLIEMDSSWSYHGPAYILMYGCYGGLDTSANLQYHNDLWKVYIDFLENEVELERSGDEALALEILAMCYIKIEEITSAYPIYEMLALYHPDPNIRLAASWNYGELQDLIENGEGGGYSFSTQAEKKLFEQKAIEKINKKINDDPKLRNLKNRFDNEIAKKEDKIQKQLESKSDVVEKDNIRKTIELDNRKSDRAKNNLIFSRTLSKSEQETRRLEDITLSTINARTITNKNSGFNLAPLEYKLSQNYPNPFNPVTRIDFQLPKDVNVKIKIYDVSGREIKTLINEFKQAGSYNVSFDGTNLSSGAYFYRIEAGDFIQTKRMVLFK